MYSVVLENENFLIVNKDSGVLVHKTGFNVERNLIDEVNERSGNTYFLANRIDKNTSGLVVIAKNEQAKDAIQKLFLERKVEKTYLAIVSKELPAKKVKISLSIGRSRNNKLIFVSNNSKNYKPSVTEVSEISGKFVLAKPLTGRTHQIRCHLKSIECPILNDILYGGDYVDEDYGQFLHSYSIGFTCPMTGKEIFARSPLPDRFIGELEKMNIDYSEYV